MSAVFLVPPREFARSSSRLLAVFRLGGVFLSLYIIFEWLKVSQSILFISEIYLEELTIALYCTQTLHENFVNLSGRMAHHDEFPRILYLVSRFKGIIEISEIQIYHVGEDYVSFESSSPKGKTTPELTGPVASSSFLLTDR